MGLPDGYWVLAGIGVLADLRPLTGYDARHRPINAYLSSCTSVAILLVWGVGPAMAAQAAASLAAALRSGLAPARAILLILRTAAALAAAAAAIALTGLGSVRRSEGIGGSVLVDFLVAALAWLITYYGPVVIWRRWRRHWTWPTVLDRGLGVDVLASASLLALAPVVVAEPRGWTFALLVLPVLAVNQMTWLLDRQAASLRRDSLTGLLSQRGLAEVTAELGRGLTTGPGRFAVIVVRVARLRDLVDAFGQSTVEAVLVRVAGRLSGAVSEGMSVGRADSDDFIILVRRPDAPDPDPVGPTVTTIAQSLQEPAEVDGVPYDVTAMIGTAWAPEDGSDLPALIRAADAAIRAGSTNQGAPAEVLSRQHDDPNRRVQLLTDLADALAGGARGGRIEFVYQPQVRLDSELMVGVEALMRWTHPERGAVSPAEFVRVAESTPLMQAVTQLAIDTVTAQLQQWNELGIRMRAAVNVSVHDLRQDRLVDTILDRVASTGIAPDQLVIEITEGEIISDIDRVTIATRRLAGVGIQIALDDFGSGFASLQHLRQLDFDELKIDKSLIIGVADRTHDRDIVRAVVELARALNLTVIAEGVESRVVHDVLRDLLCPIGQGWLYGRPATGTEIARRWAAQPRLGTP